MIYLYTLVAGFTLFAIQILHQEWRLAGKRFKADLGSADKVFPRFTGEYVQPRAAAPRKYIYNSNR